MPILLQCNAISDPTISAHAQVLMKKVLVTDTTQLSTEISDLQGSYTALPDISSDEAIIQEISRCSHLDYPTAFRTAICLEQVCSRLQYARSEVLDAARAATTQPLGYTVLQILNLVRNHLKDSVDAELSPALLQQLMRMASNAAAITELLLPTITATSRLARDVASAACDIYVLSQFYTSESATLPTLPTATENATEKSLSLFRESLTIHRTADAATRAILEAGGSMRLKRWAAQLFSATVKASIDTSAETPLLQSLLGVLPELGSFLLSLDPETECNLVVALVDLDDNHVGLGEWILQQEVELAESCLGLLPTSDPVREQLLQRGIDRVFAFLEHLLDSEEHKLALRYLQESMALERCFRKILEPERGLTSPASIAVAQALRVEPTKMDEEMRVALALVLLRTIATRKQSSLLDVMNLLRDVDRFAPDDLQWLCSELGRTLLSLNEGDADTALAVSDLLNFVLAQGGESSILVSEGTYNRLLELLDPHVPQRPISSFSSVFEFVDDDAMIADVPLVSWRDPLPATREELEQAMARSRNGSRTGTPPPSTPPSILGMGTFRTRLSVSHSTDNVPKLHFLLSLSFARQQLRWLH